MSFLARRCLTHLRAHFLLQEEVCLIPDVDGFLQKWKLENMMAEIWSLIAWKFKYLFKMLNFSGASVVPQKYFHCRQKCYYFK